ncbi:MAG: S26 family signal peptidase [SAR202 cluster bacterium]|jgi:signal peptidase I|nr:S26 family signal peptidase [SAR202 cluster bacterium]|tara:strand:+ start:4707 stop:5078 length:372 start_codon:yes stop_codon:yes gene_type:complete
MKRLHFNFLKIFMAIELKGASMAPALNSGDWLLFKRIDLRASGPGALEKLIGEVVLLRRRSEFGSDILQVKRVIQLTAGNSRIWVEGDSKDESTDSRNWGALERNEVIGRLLLRYKKGKKLAR